MKGRVGVNGGGVPADLVVCFPSRARLRLMPKPICSPSRPSETACKRPAARPAAGRRSQASPIFKTETKLLNSDDEPTSPKVTCAGQIKVSRPKCRSKSSTDAAGGSVRSSTRKPHWLDAVGLKKDVMQFLGAGFRGLRFPVGSCFGSFPGPVGCVSDDDEDEDEEAYHERVLEKQHDQETEGNGSKTIFSKWFMVLEENQALEFKNNKEDEEITDDVSVPGRPPANALLLMRCRSAPAKGWLKRREVDEEEEEEEEEEDQKPKRSENEEINANLLINEEEREKERSRLVLMSYDASDYLKISTDIAKETWIVGCVDPMVRSRSWKR